MSFEKYIPEDIRDLYEIHDYKHAAAILASEFPDEFAEICKALREFKILETDITTAGGRESQIPKNISNVLRPLGWTEGQLNAKMLVDDVEIKHDTHKIDYIKGRVAFDLEWNSKDQTYDRDLYAFRNFFDFDKISVGVLMTRSNLLDPYFAGLGSYVDESGKTKRYKDKYGSSTTQMGKLIPRLDSGRNGGCPILVIGITPNVIREAENVETTAEQGEAVIVSDMGTMLGSVDEPEIASEDNDN